jgi:hypothetical protein
MFRCTIPMSNFFQINSEACFVHTAKFLHPCTPTAKLVSPSTGLPIVLPSRLSGQLAVHCIRQVSIIAQVPLQRIPHFGNLYSKYGTQQFFNIKGTVLREKWVQLRQPEPQLGLNHESPTFKKITFEGTIRKLWTGQQFIQGIYLLYHDLTHFFLETVPLIKIRLGLWLTSVAIWPNGKNCKKVD